jgi:DNA-binding transcriptional regulator YiaG
VPNVMGVLRSEIRRLARKEMKEAVRELKRQVAAIRRRLASTKKRMTDVERTARRAVSPRGATAAREDSRDDGTQVRFSPRWVKVHRAKLGMSRRVYAKLVGVSPQTILLWESGKARPRRSALATWRSIRGKGIRELKAAVGGETRGRRGRRPKAAGRAAVRKRAARRGARKAKRGARKVVRRGRRRIARTSRVRARRTRVVRRTVRRRVRRAKRK